MSDITRLEQVRRLVLQTLCKLGVPGNEGPQETLLIRNGCYCGRRFESHGWRIVWFLEEDQIKVYAPEGNLTQSTTTGQLEEESLARAA